MYIRYPPVERKNITAKDAPLLPLLESRRSVVASSTREKLTLNTAQAAPAPRTPASVTPNTEKWPGVKVSRKY